MKPYLIGIDSDGTVFDSMAITNTIMLSFPRFRRSGVPSTGRNFYPVFITPLNPMSEPTRKGNTDE